MIHINKSHRSQACLSTSSISQYFQELLNYMGQHTCYQQVSEIVEKLVGTATNAMQIQRLTTAYGAQVGELLTQATPAEVMEDEELIDKFLLLNQGAINGDQTIGSLDPLQHHFRLFRSLNGDGLHLYVGHLQAKIFGHTHAPLFH